MRLDRGNDADVKYYPANPRLVVRIHSVIGNTSELTRHERLRFQSLGEFHTS